MHHAKVMKEFPNYESYEISFERYRIPINVSLNALLKMNKPTTTKTSNVLIHFIKSQFLKNGK